MDCQRSLAEPGHYLGHHLDRDSAVDASRLRFTGDGYRLCLIPGDVLRDGAGAAVVQKADVDVTLLRRVFGVVLVIHFTLAALLFLAAPLIAAFYVEPRVTPVLRALSFQFVLAGFAVIPDAQLQRRMEFRNRSLLDLSGAIVASFTTLAMALSGFGVWALVVGSLLSQFWKTIGINVLSPFLHRPDFSLVGLRSMLRFGGEIAASQVFWVFFSQIDILLCAKWLGKETLGFYSVAMHLASLPNQRISSLVNQVAFPAFSSMQLDIPRVAKNLLSGARMLSFFAFPVLWGLSSVAGEVVSVALGAKWMSAALPLQTLGLIMPLRLIGNFTQVAIQGIGRSDIVLRNAITASIIGPIIFFIGINWWGLMGLSFAWLVLSPLVFLQGTLRGLPLLGLRVQQLLMSMMPAAASSLIMYLAVIVAKQTPAFESGGLLKLMALIAIGALSYCGASYYLNRKGIDEVLEMARGIATAKPNRI